MDRRENMLQVCVDEQKRETRQSEDIEVTINRSLEY